VESECLASIGLDMVADTLSGSASARAIVGCDFVGVMNAGVGKQRVPQIFSNVSKASIRSWSRRSHNGSGLAFDRHRSQPGKEMFH